MKCGTQKNIITNNSTENTVIEEIENELTENQSTSKSEKENTSKAKNTTNSKKNTSSSNTKKETTSTPVTTIQDEKNKKQTITVQGDGEKHPIKGDEGQWTTESEWFELDGDVTFIED